jgi:2-methylcitrate dehydratase PrpD
MSTASAPRRSIARNVPVTTALARLACETVYANAPDEIRQIARHCLLDYFAVTLAGAQDPLSQILLAEAEEQGGRPAATLIGHRWRVPTQLAALVNGAAAHALDFDDVNLTMGGHPSVTILPALLALAETRGASGMQLLEAFLAGYETQCRIGALVAPGHYERGIHATGTIGTFGAAAACARFLGLDAEATATALGIAATQAAGLKSMFGTMCKPLHAGKAAQNGLLAATLAARGFTSRTDVLECAQGFAAAQSPDFRPEAALAAPKGGWHLRNNLFKYHAACYLTHAPIECARAIRRRVRFQPEAVRRVVLRLDNGASTVCHILSPKSGLEAKFSLRQTVAMALAGLDTASLATYSDEKTRDPMLATLRDRILIEFQRGWPHTLANIDVTLADGRVLSAGHDSGVPATDLDEQGQRLTAKFMSLATPVLSLERAERLAQKIELLDQLESVAELTRLAVPI